MAEEKPKLGDWLKGQMEARGLNAGHLHRMAKAIGKSLAISTVNQEGVIKNAFSEPTIELILMLLKERPSLNGNDEQLPTLAEIKAKFEYVPKEYRSPGVSQPPPLFAVIGDLESKSRAMNAEQYISLFDAIRPDRRSFMVTITAGKLPTMLDNDPFHLKIRQAIFRAMANGMLLLYLVPSQKKLTLLRKYGQTAPLMAGVYTAGFKQLKAEVVEDDRIKNKECLRLIALDELHIATPHYITVLIGEEDGFGHCYKKIIERGPAGNARQSVPVAAYLVNSDANYETDVARYVARVLVEKGRDEFAELIIKRMGIQIEE